MKIRILKILIYNKKQSTLNKYKIYLNKFKINNYKYNLYKMIIIILMINNN